MFIDGVFGNLMICTLFASVDGTVTKARNHEACPTKGNLVLRMMLFDACATIFVLLPNIFRVVFHRRSFVSDSIRSRRRNYCKWLAKDISFWTLGVAYTFLTMYFITVFVANVDDNKQHVKLTAMMLYVWFRHVFGAPFFMAVVMTFLAKKIVPRVDRSVHKGQAPKILGIDMDEVHDHGAIPLRDEEDKQESNAKIDTYIPPAESSEQDKEAWQKKVVEMSHRGISLRNLLNFCEMLGQDIMPHFDPEKNTTADVVRQAVVPLSRESTFKNLVCSLAISVVSVRFNRPVDKGSNLVCSCEVRRKPGKPNSKLQTPPALHEDADFIWTYTSQIDECTFGEPLEFVVYDAARPADPLDKGVLRSLQFYTTGFDGELQLEQGSVLVIRVVVSPLGDEDIAMVRETSVDESGQDTSLLQEDVIVQSIGSKSSLPSIFGASRSSGAGMRTTSTLKPTLSRCNTRFSSMSTASRMSQGKMAQTLCRLSELEDLKIAAIKDEQYIRAQSLKAEADMLTGSVLEEGVQVRIQGLRIGKEFNGMSATCEGWDNSQERWVVRLDNGESKALRQDNLALEFEDGASLSLDNEPAEEPPPDAQQCLSTARSSMSVASEPDVIRPHSVSSAVSNIEPINAGSTRTPRCLHCCPQTPRNSSVAISVRDDPKPFTPRGMPLTPRVGVMSVVQPCTTETKTSPRSREEHSLSNPAMADQGSSTHNLEKTFSHEVVVDGDCTTSQNSNPYKSIESLKCFDGTTTFNSSRSFRRGGSLVSFHGTTTQNSARTSIHIRRQGSLVSVFSMDSRGSMIKSYTENLAKHHSLDGLNRVESRWEDADAKPFDHGYSYSTVASGDQPLLPDMMVTHNWGNKFCHLMAAVIADACGKKRYKHYAKLLSQREFEQLREHLGERIDRVYWICAFCVNQHQTICHRSRSKTDTTGWPITLCNCSMKPITGGNDCEVNKFDDMMAFCKKRVREIALQSDNPTARHHRFGQVIAVDVDFDLITRVWCIAELYEADRSHLTQAMKIFTQMSDDGQQSALAKVCNIDVRNAEASQPSDKEFVLSKIEDIDEFNQHVKRLVLKRMNAHFGGAHIGDIALIDYFLLG